MKREKLKQPNDYPVLAFRIDKATKDELETVISGLLIDLNRDRQEDEKIIKKNDVIVRALKIGLKQLLKK